MDFRATNQIFQAQSPKTIPIVFPQSPRSTPIFIPQSPRTTPIFIPQSQRTIPIFIPQSPRKPLASSLNPPLGSWARKWGMRFQPVKCNMMQLTRKRIKKIHASYTLEGTNLENVESIKYLGVTITSDLRWNTHVSNVCTKANRTLGFLRRNLYSCPQEVKEAAYKGLVRPVLDYGSSVWDPPGVVLQEELESVQKRAARFVTGNYNYETGSMTGILGQLKWESLKKKRKDNRLILLYKGLKGKASVPTDDLIPKTRRCRNQHSMAFQTPIANTDVYKGSFFPQTIRDWNALPDSLISSAEDAEDCVAKFTSLVRARD